MVSIDRGQMGGVWSNFAVVKHSLYEFTIDFARLDFTESQAQGVVVSRVNLSPLMVRQLIDALEENWNDFASKSLPPEVNE